MIRERSVFILGAGAHCSYGFPSGEDLKREVATRIEGSMRKRPGFAPGWIVSACQVPPLSMQPANCTAFVEDLKNCAQGSIDAFIHARRSQPGMDVLAKVAVADVLLKYEQLFAQGRAKTDDDWIRYLTRLMIEGVHEPADFAAMNDVSFITFNYDRLLEYSLTTMVAASFGLKREVAAAVVRTIPITHVYGDLGPLDTTEFGNTLDDAWIAAHRNIRTIFEVESKDEKLEPIRETILKAKRIYLIGFGYHRENIELLGLSNAIAELVRDKQGAVCSTRYGMTDAEFKRGAGGIDQYITRSTDSSKKSLESMREFYFA